MNNKGFVVSAVLYPLLVLFLALVMGLLSMSSTRKNILDNMKMDIGDSIFDSVTCDCELINSTLEKYGNSITNIEKTIAEIQTDIDNITDLGTDITEIKNKMTSLTNQVTSLTTRMTTSETKITNIENNYAKKTDLSSYALKTDLNSYALKTDLDSYAKTATTDLLDGKITDLTTTVSNLSTKVTNLETRVNTLAKSELTIYMSPSGSDSNDGLTSSKPMKTLQSVLDKYSNNTLTIMLAKGNYEWGNVEVKNRTLNILGLPGDNTPVSCSARVLASSSQACLNSIEMGYMIIDNSTLRMHNIKMKVTAQKSDPFPYSKNLISYPTYYLYDENKGQMYSSKSQLLFYDVYLYNSKTTTLLFLTDDSRLEAYASKLISSGTVLSSENNSSSIFIDSWLESTSNEQSCDYATIINNNSMTSTGNSIVYAKDTDNYYACNTSGTVTVLKDKIRGKKSGTVTISR